MMGMPKPLDPTESFTAVDDAWNRLVELTDDNASSSGGDQLVAEYEWDGMGRRIMATSYDDGLLEETRHFYYSAAHQILEERVDGTADSDMDLQYVWGAQYVDELICRDRPGDPSSSSSSAEDERIYVTHDPSYRITALVDGDKNVLERYRYSPYGQRTVLNPDWTTHTDPEEGSYNFRIGHQGLRHDETGLVYNRARMLHVGLGRFTQRDPIGYLDGTNVYAAYHVMYGDLDPSGLFCSHPSWKCIHSHLEHGNYAYARALIEKLNSKNRQDIQKLIRSLVLASNVLDDIFESLSLDVPIKPISEDGECCKGGRKHEWRMRGTQAQAGLKASVTISNPYWDTENEELPCCPTSGDYYEVLMGPQVEARAGAGGDFSAQGGVQFGPEGIDLIGRLGLELLTAYLDAEKRGGPKAGAIELGQKWGKGVGFDVGVFRSFTIFVEESGGAC
ncbi:MAG: RHS repeat-associated core domain-containing protein [Phycisphaeraceae bacterium]